MTLSPKDNPHQLFPDNVLEDFDAYWHIAHVKSRREKALAHFLAKENIGYYLPMFLKKQNSSQRARHSLVPVFSGYLFFIGNEQQRHTAFRSNHIARTINVPDAGELLSELGQIRKALSTGMPVHPSDFLDKGQRVRVTKGPFQDIEGLIVRRKNEYRLVISITSIMQAMSIEIDVDQIEPL